MAVDTIQVVAPPKEAIPYPESSAPLRLTGWDHIAFSVPDLVEAERWYVDVLGAEVVSRYNWGGETAHPVPPHEDIRIGSQVVSLFLGDQIGGTTVPRLFHYAFNCRNLEELEQWQAHLRAKGVNTLYLYADDGTVPGHTPILVAHGPALISASISVSNTDAARITGEFRAQGAWTIDLD